MKRPFLQRLWSLGLTALIGISVLSGCTVSQKEKAEPEADKESAAETTLQSTEELTQELSFKVEYYDDTEGWSDLSKSDGKLFGSTGWEPGSSRIVRFQVKNTGKIGFDWQVAFDAPAASLKWTDAISVYTKADDTEFDLSSQRLTEGNGFFYRDSLKDLLTEKHTLHSSELEAGETVYFAIALKMSETAGNEYQALNLKDVSVVFGIKERILTASSRDGKKKDGFSIAVSPDQITLDGALPGEVKEGFTVTNTGDCEQYVRVTLTVSDRAAFQKYLGDAWSAESLLVDPVWDQGGEMTLDSVSEKGDDTVLVLYLNRTLSPGESIVLCKGVEVPTELTKEALVESTLRDAFTVDALAQAVYTASPAVKDAKSAFAYAEK